jgi:putative endonuclease
LANGFKKLYIGITTEIEIRMRQHKRKADQNCHTARCNITQLVYFERFVDIEAAIAREKKLKGWLRIRKIELIVQSNPTWKDLSADWGKTMEMYRWPEE